MSTSLSQSVLIGIYDEDSNKVCTEPNFQADFDLFCSGVSATGSTQVDVEDLPTLP